MTEFRTKGKGKNRAVYPVSKKQPFGITRNLASDEVQALRQGGKRARLIKTNQKLGLYAPYVSDLAVPEAEAPQLQAPKEEHIREQTGKEESRSSIPKEDLPMINLVKENEKKFDLLSPTLFNEGGSSFITMMDRASIMAGWKKLKDNVSPEATAEFNELSRAIRIPMLSYTQDDGMLSLGVQERNNIKMLARELAKEMSEDVDFIYGNRKKRKGSYNVYDLNIGLYKPDEGRYGYIVVVPGSTSTPDSTKTYGHAMRVEMAGNSNRLGLYNAKAFLTSLQLYDTLTDAPKGKKSRGENYVVSFKDDYPVVISKDAPDGASIRELDSGVVLAPKVYDQFDRRMIRDAVRKLTGGA